MTFNNTKQGGAMPKHHRFSSFSFFSLLRGFTSNGCLLIPISYRFVVTVALLLSVPAVQADQMETAAPAIKPGDYQYKLIMSRDDKVCRHMLTLYNGDLKKYGYEKYDEHKEFNTIQWAPVKYVLKVDNDRRPTTDQLAKFDVNNDGTREIIIKSLSTMKWGHDAYSYYVFPERGIDFTREIDPKEFKHLLGGLDIWGMYQLKELPADVVLPNGRTIHQLAAMRVQEPFILSGFTYIGFRGAYEIHMSDLNRHLVIAKYRDNASISSDSKPDILYDVCYFRLDKATGRTLNTK